MAVLALTAKGEVVITFCRLRNTRASCHLKCITIEYWHCT